MWRIQVLIIHDPFSKLLAPTAAPNGAEPYSSVLTESAQPRTEQARHTQILKPHLLNTLNPLILNDDALELKPESQNALSPKHP